MTATTHDNYHQAELDRFAALANRWWDAEGPQRPLHVLNPVRLDYVKQRLPAPGLHGLESGVKVDYQVKAVEALAEERPGSFDAITCMEMLEHVPDPAAIIAACAQLLRPGGRLFLSTLNRTPAAFALAIVGAEYVARLLPRGTHHYDGFIKPSELAAWLRAADLQLEDVSGLFYDPLRQRARLSARTGVNYLACATRPGVAA